MREGRLERGRERGERREVQRNGRGEGRERERERKTIKIKNYIPVFLLTITSTYLVDPSFWLLLQ